MLGFEENKFSLAQQIKKIIILVIFIIAFPIIMPFFGIDVIKTCITYTISDYEIAKANPDITIEIENLGECKMANFDTVRTNDVLVTNPDLLIGVEKTRMNAPMDKPTPSSLFDPFSTTSPFNLNRDKNLVIVTDNNTGTGLESSGSKLVGYFKDGYIIYTIILVSLIVIIPGYNIIRYRLD